MSTMIRRSRSPYIPAWGDEKHRQAVRSASLCQFGEDLTDPILNEVGHRSQRTARPDRPGQPWPIADLKVWLRFARLRGNLELEARMAAAVAAWYQRSQ
jgi:hypothetical protein